MGKIGEEGRERGRKERRGRKKERERERERRGGGIVDGGLRRWIVVWF